MRVRKRVVLKICAPCPPQCAGTYPARLTLNILCRKSGRGLCIIQCKHAIRCHYADACCKLSGHGLAAATANHENKTFAKPTPAPEAVRDEPETPARARNPFANSLFPKRVLQINMLDNSTFLTGTTKDHSPMRCYTSFYFYATHGQCRSLIQSKPYSLELTIDMIDPVSRKKSPTAVPRY